jgi:G-patch domain
MEGWERTEEKSGRTIYYNKEHDISTYDKPDELKSKSELERDRALESGSITSVSFDEDSAKAGSEIDASNIGFKMLSKLGYSSGKGLGKDSQGSFHHRR